MMCITKLFSAASLKLQKKEKERKRKGSYLNTPQINDDLHK